MIVVGGWGIHIFGAKVLNLIELPEIIDFFYIYEINISVSIFSSITGASRILNLNLILMVLYFFLLQNTLHIVMFKHFCFKKLSYGRQYIFLIACI